MCKQSVFFRVSFLALLLAFCVVILGAYTRISDAGLSCPDWPGCYGHIGVPQDPATMAHAQSLYPDTPIEPKKAWTEMVHRYLAGSLGLLILGLTIAAYRGRDHMGPGPLRICTAMIVLIIFQIFLGKWTVTMRLLPLVVSSHLMMGMTLLSLLCWLCLLSASGERLRKVGAMPQLRPWAGLALLLVIMQMDLGGWTSTNMVGQLCAGFPICENIPLSNVDWLGAFAIFTPLGHFPYAAAVAITMMHRIGGVVVLFYVGGLALYLLTSLRYGSLRLINAHILGFLVVQVGLGMMNMSASRPVWSAVMHNAFAAFLLCSVLALNVVLYLKQRSGGAHDE